MSEQKAEYLGEVPEDVQHEIRDESPHDFFTMIPHLVEALDLTPCAFRLYAHLKRVTGENKEGKCWKSTKTLAEACRMSMGAISNAKKELENTYPPLVRIVSQKKENGIYHEITIIDIWKQNHNLGTGQVVHLVKTPRKPSPGETPPSPGETKKSTVNKNPLREISSKKERPEKKGDILDGILHFEEVALTQGIDKIEQTLTVLEKGLKRNIPRTGQWQDLAKWLNKQSTPLSKWINWYMSNEFQANTSWRMKPDDIRNSFPQVVETPKPQPAPKPVEPEPKYIVDVGRDLIDKYKKEHGK